MFIFGDSFNIPNISQCTDQETQSNLLKIKKKKEKKRLKYWKEAGNKRFEVNEHVMAFKQECRECTLGTIGDNAMKTKEPSWLERRQALQSVLPDV